MNSPSPFWKVPMTSEVMEELAFRNEQKREEAIEKLGGKWVLASTRRFATARQVKEFFDGFFPEKAE